MTMISMMLLHEADMGATRLLGGFGKLQAYANAVAAMICELVRKRQQGVRQLRLPCMFGLKRVDGGAREACFPLATCTKERSKCGRPLKQALSRRSQPSRW